MPKDLAAGNPPGMPQDYQIHFPGRTTAGTVQSPPKDYAKWRELIRVVTAHFVQRYGRQTVLQWYFEVWNEPDGGYWHSTPDQYWKLYDYAVSGVRAALPGARVGGPATTPPTQDRAYKFLGDFLDHVNTGKSAADGGPVPMDFISFHIKGQPKITDGLVHMGLGKELNDAARGFGLVAKYPKFRKLPIILSEADPEGCGACSSRQNPANGYRNDTMYPTYTAAVFKALFELQDRYKVNLISMLNWAFEFENKDYFEGFRSLATNGIDLPVLNAIRMFSLMDGERVATTSSGQIPLDSVVKDGVSERPDIDAMATKANHQAAVLVWNYHDLDAPGPAAPTAIAVNGIPAGIRRVLVTHWRIDDTHSNAYTGWKAMGSPQSPTPEQYAALKASDGLQLLGSPNWADVTEGKITVNTQMPRKIGFVISIAVVTSDASLGVYG